MKGKLLLLSLIGCIKALAQQSTVHGIVSIHNSETRTGKRQYVSNAQVEDYYNKAQPTVTKENGKFTLIYVGVNENASISFQVKKPGLQVVNTDALSAIAGQNELVRISMAHPDSIAEYRRKIYNVGKTEAEKYLENQVRRKNKELGDLRKYSLQNKAKVNQLEQELSQLEEQRGKIEEQATDLAKRYAPVNLDDASFLFREAFILFQKGNTDAAQLLLKQADLPGKVDSILLEEKKIEKGKKEYNERESIKNQRKKEYAKGLQLKADLHKTRNEFDSTSECYELLIKLDSLNVKYLFDYALFFQWLNQHDKAINYFLLALRIGKSNSKINPRIYEQLVANAQNNLGILYSNKNDYAKADAAFLEALEINRHLTSTFPQIYEPYLAATQDNLGNLYKIKGDYHKAETAHLAALEIRKRLVKVSPQTYESDLAATQCNLGNLYQIKGDYPKAESAYLEALEIRKRLTKIDSQSSEHELAKVQHNLGTLYSIQNDYVKGEAALLEALEVYKPLAKVNSKTYDPAVAVTQTNLGNLYKIKSEYPKAESAYLEALEISKRLAKVNAQAYEPNLALIQNNLGHLYLSMKYYVQAENFLIESLNIVEKLMSKYPLVYTTELSQTAMNLLHVYTSTLDTLKYDAFKRAKQNNFETVENLINSQSKKDSKLAQSLSVYYGNCSWYLLFALKFKEAERVAEKGLAIESANTWIKTNLAHSLLFQGRYQDALKVYQELKGLKNEEDKSYASICIEDLDELEKNGVTNKDVNKIRVFLKE